MMRNLQDVEPIWRRC